MTVNLLHSGTRMRPILLFSLACAAAARVTEVDCSARFRECLREPGDDAHRDHLSQASLGAVDEDGGVDVGDGVEAGNIG